MLVILVVALLVVGPAKLPGLARSLGRAFSEFRKMADDVKGTIENEVLRQDEPEGETPKGNSPADKTEAPAENKDSPPEQKA